MIEANWLSKYWSDELEEEVLIQPRGWSTCPIDYELFISGTPVVSFKHLDEINSYLERYFVLNG